jgi:hypothetical protein
LDVLRHALALHAVCLAVVLWWRLGPSQVSLAALAYLLVGAALSGLVRAVWGRAMQVACLYCQVVALWPPADAGPPDLAPQLAMAWHGLGMAAMVVVEVLGAVICDVVHKPKPLPTCNPQKESDS